MAGPVILYIGNAKNECPHFETAEKYASELDFLLFSSASIYLGGAEDKLKENAKGISEMFESLASFRTAIFRDIYGKVIALD